MNKKLASNLIRIAVLVALVVCSPLAADPPVGISTHVLCNTSPYLCVGIDANAGGAIKLLTTDWSIGYLFKSNLVDNGLPDKGRQIQASFYQIGESYPSCWPCDAGCDWGWNPVQAGSCSNQGSGTVSVTQTATTLTSVTQPLQWDADSGTSNITLRQELSFALSNAIKIKYTITNNESFQISRTQELPVAYFETILDTAKTYTGSSPWTNDTVSEFSLGTNQHVDPNATEKWIGWFNSSDGNGVALFVPPQSIPTATWRIGDLGGTDVPTTHYLQNWANMTLGPGRTISLVAFIVTGSLEEIRSSIYTLSGVSPTNKSFQATADAWVSEQYPNNNYGSDFLLYTRGSGSGLARHAYLKFNVSGLTGGVQSAKLRFRSYSSYPSAMIYRLATTSWSENSITWNNAPLDPLGSKAVGYLSASSWQEIDITDMIDGEGLYTIGLVSADRPGLRFWSRESGYIPSLVVTEEP